MYIIEFIKQHSDWKELLSNPPYSLLIKGDEDSDNDGLYLFKYNQIESDFNEPIVREARGLILDSKDNWKVVRYAFSKFFNYGESFAAQIDWKTARVQEKLDGSLISLWYWHRKNKWMVSTSGTIDAFKAEVYDRAQSPIALDKTTFGDMFKGAFRIGTENLNKDYTYTFELVDPYNHVIKYDKVDIWHIGTRDNVSLKELNVDIGVQKPKEYPLHNLDAVLKAVAELNSNDKIEHEGFVVVDANWERVKIKNALYITGHYLMGNTISFKKCVDIIGLNEKSEFLSYFPQHVDFFNKVESLLQKVEADMEESYDITYSDIISKGMPKRDVAMFIEKFPPYCRSYIFTKIKNSQVTPQLYLFGGEIPVEASLRGTLKLKGWAGIYDLIKYLYKNKYST